MIELYGKNLENKPKRLQPTAFVESIVDLPLRNEFLPEFDTNACEILSSLSLSLKHPPTFGDAFRRLSKGGHLCLNCGLPYRLKLIFLGYCITHQWTMWATLERGTPVRLVPISLIESPHFLIATDFSFAHYGALKFRIFRIERMDQMETIGPPDFDVPRWSDLDVMNAVKLQEVRPDGLRCRSVALERMLVEEGLSGNIVTIPRSVRAEIIERTQSFWAERRITTGGMLATPLTTGEITVSDEGEQGDERGRGRPNKKSLVQEGFFYCLALMEGDNLPGITTAKRKISDLLAKLNQQGIVDDTAHPKTVRDQLMSLGYLKKQSGRRTIYTWVPEAWAHEFEQWRKRKKI